MIYLISCVISGRIPEAEQIQDIDLEELFQVSQNHVLTAVTAYALESIGIQDHAFTQAKAKAIRKNILLDAERTKLFRILEAEHIWYMPLKGALLKDWYPKTGMRQMSDNDILYDREYRDRVKEIMLEEGFRLEKTRKNVDEYAKNPVYYFEMHIDLFSEYREKFYRYYEDIRSRLIQDEHKNYGCHFRDEDFYIYLILHEYKHYADGGTGIRSLLDVYIFIGRSGKSLDMEYIQTELEKLNAVGFERQTRELAMKLFGFAELSADERQLLDQYIFSGAYGTFANAGKNKIESEMQGTGKTAKLSYIFHRLFPPMRVIRSEYPFFYRYKVLIPVLWLIRPFMRFSVNRKRMISEIKYLWMHK